MNIRDQIAAARALADAATPAPWIVNGIGMEIANFGADEERNKWTLNLVPTSSAVAGSQPAKHDAILAAASRTLVPQLATLLERACELLEADEQQLAKVVEDFDSTKAKAKLAVIRAFLAGEVTNV